MYRRFYRNDELISNVLISFALLLLYGFLISWKLVGVDTFDAEMIVYIVTAGITFLLFVFNIVVYLIGIRKPIIDIEIDFNQKMINTFNSRFKHSIDNIILYSFNKRHKQVRILVDHRLIGFSIDEMVDKKGQPVTEETLQKLANNAVVVEPKQLYNYHLLLVLVMMGFTVFYMILASRASILIFSVYIPTYYAMIACFIFSSLVVFLNHLRLQKLYQKNTFEKGTES